ncbi:MAG: CoA transferase [Gammaproteobacteria bacterium]|nr:CoA transferase [Gammaproteobacteria bacterium]MXY06520.1 CoA transferase [Gammaproteobacteria bacterium]MYE53134.1 CoA transferase [Gammaproteobacteria bacterium]MYF49864.1 CoA transferase [Gammaproteobacteria bacterium]MYG11187.1 CoA transferase [Gammaproteobacteria bacterium]
MQPLEGTRVLEFSTMITASLPAMMMGEQGASVIKVEPVELGDPMRYLGSSKGGMSALFANCNRGKQSLSLDLKSAEARAVVEQLVAEADVLLCNYRPGVMDKLGFGSQHLRSLNPRLIYCAISGFGTEGPDRGTPAYDPIIQAQSGFAAVQGAGKAGPEFVRNLTCDKITAYTAFQAVTAALLVREKTGEGQHIDLSMMDAGLFFLFPDGFMHRTLLDEDAEHNPPLSELLYELTVTKDGAITLSAANQAQQVGLMAAIDQLHLLADERFNSMEKLIANIDELREILRREFLKHETDDLLQKLKENDVPAAKCLDYEEVLAHPQYQANASIDRFEHPRMGSMIRVKPPAQFGGERTEPGGASPAHGEHTVEILQRLGTGDAEIERLIAEGLARGTEA